MLSLYYPNRHRPNMKKRLNNILLPSLFLLLFVTIATLGYVINAEIEKSKVQLDADLSSLLELAIKQYGNSTSKNTPIIGNYKNDPKLFGTYETRTFRTADTTFTYQHKIVDMETQIVTSNQFFLLLTDSLRSKDIQTILDSILIARKIAVRTAIGISSSGYPVKQLPWSGDTLSIHRNGCAQYTMTDDFTQIHYTAYLEYDPATIWTRVNKTPIWLWGIVFLIMSGLTSFQLINKYKKKKAIAESKKGLYIEERYIRFSQNEVKASPQSIAILQLFLDAEQRKVAKDTLKELWVPKGERANNMYSAINRINRLLNEIECDLRIISDPEDADFYLLQ